jgi:hypothetical protein
MEVNLQMAANAVILVKKSEKLIVLRDGASMIQITSIR